MSVVPSAFISSMLRRSFSVSVSSMGVEGRRISVVDPNATTAIQSPRRSAPSSALLAPRASSMARPSINPEVLTTSARLTGGRSARSTAAAVMRSRAATGVGRSERTKRLLRLPTAVTA